MPEGPEVAVVTRGLRSVLVGATIDRYRSLHHCFVDALPRVHIINVHRHGKWIVLETAQHRAITLHLGMSGRFHLGGPVHRHARWIAILDDGRERRLLQFVDPRCMGRLRVHGALESSALLDARAVNRGCPLMGLGPDAMGRFLTRGDAVRVNAWWRTALNTPLEIKRALMAQHVVAGLGNIYAAEACWLARVSPFRPGRDLRRSEIHVIAREVPRLLLRSLRLGGTSLGDANTFVDHRGREGSAWDILNVYGRAGAKCPRCSGTIRRDRQIGRSTFWCAGCQT